MGIEGIDGIGGTVGSKSAGMLLKRVEYRLFTRSDVYKSQLHTVIMTRHRTFPEARGGRGGWSCSDCEDGP